AGTLSEAPLLFRLVLVSRPPPATGANAAAVRSSGLCTSLSSPRIGSNSRGNKTRGCHHKKRDFLLDATSPCARERTFFCARPRTTDVGARAMPRSVVTAGPLCNESEFAKRIGRFANLDSTQHNDMT